MSLDRWGRFRPRSAMTRRSVLRGALAGVGVAALAGCGGPDDSGGTGTGQNGVATGDCPTPAAWGQTPEPVEGMLSSGIPGVPEAYYELPPPFRSVEDVPGGGGDVRSITIAYNPPPTDFDDNEYWQELDERLGVHWAQTIIPQPVYGERTAAMTAGRDLGDIFYINPGQNAWPLYTTVEQGAFMDLTAILTCELEDYPNLANPAVIPPDTWEKMKINGKIWGVPKPILRIPGFNAIRVDWLENLGIELPTDADGVFEMYVALAQEDPDGNGRHDTWALAPHSGSWGIEDFGRMYEMPHNWRLNDDGTLTKNLETEAYAQAIEFSKRLQEAGAYHPDTASMNFDQYTALFEGGRIAIRGNNPFTVFRPEGLQDTLQQVNTEARLTGFLMPLAGGGGPGPTYNRPVQFGFNAIPAEVGQDTERVRELLRIMNYINAPFGSEEWVFLRYGIEGVHHEVTDEGPMLTDQGTADIADLVYNLTNYEFPYFVPGRQELAQEILDWTVQIHETGIDDPTANLYSPAQVSKGAQLDQFILDNQTAFITGRRPTSEIEDFLQEWRDRGGDEIRKEFEEALAQSK